ncbi:MAG: hypothetical protein KIH69_001750 [Anaerolineae bacterium]|nr:hypothetical protein [Anaerolineae bacterium]
MEKPHNLLTWSEIKQQYPNQWVVLIEVEWPDMGEISRGVVFAHDTNHARVLEKQRDLKSAAILWTGKKRGLSLFTAISNDVDL